MNYRLPLFLIVVAGAGGCFGSVEPRQNRGPDASGGGDHGGENPLADAGHTTDITAPQTRLDDGPPEYHNSLTAQFAFSSNEQEVTFSCAVDQQPSVVCESPLEVLVQGEGLHTFFVVATDAAGNTDPAGAMHQWFVDTTFPVLTINSGPSTPSSESSATFQFSATEEVDYNCRVDGGASTACDSPVQLIELVEGTHEFVVAGTDRAGNTGEARYEWLVDTGAPSIEITSGPAAWTNATTATITFAAEETSAVACALDDAEFSDCDDHSSVTYVELSENTHHTVRVRATDSAGNFAVAQYEWSIDTVAPIAEILTGPSSVTAELTASFTFEVEVGAVADCQLDDADFVQCESALGVSYDSLEPNTSHLFTLRATDPAGNVTTDSLRWYVDTVAPTVTITAGPSGSIADADAAFDFVADESDVSFSCRLDSGSWGECTSPVRYTGLSDGAHQVSIRGTDLVGNTGAPAARSWTVDTTGPATTITSGPSGLTAAATATFEFSSEAGATFSCDLDGAGWTSCSSPTSYSSLDQGAHSFRVHATDSGGNVGAAATRSWIVDTAAPSVTIASGPEGLTGSAAATFTFSSEANATFECQLDMGGWMSCSSPASYSGLAQGEHNFEVRATDAAGNTGANASRSWSVDTVGPSATITGGPSGLTASTSAVFRFSSEANASFQCRLDGGGWESCESPGSYSGLSQGAHSFSVRAIDAAGNTGASISRSWTVDTAAPAVTITSGPSGVTASTSATFTVTSEAGASFQCQRDSGAWTGCSSPVAYASLAQGAHSFRVRATDSAGNTGDAATRTWTVDTVAPSVTIVEGPSGLTGSSGATFTFTGEANASFECQLDTGAWSECSSPTDYAGLSQGNHAFRVRARDAAGNTGSAASRAWTVDTVSPSVSITDGPAALTAATRAQFTFSSEPGAEFECRLDTGSWSNCSSPQAYANLAQGGHNFSARATDAAGNTGASAGRNWTVDSVAPTVTITSGPSGPTASTSASFGVSTELGATVECQLDGSAWSSCSSPETYTSLTQGSHSFGARATDEAGNIGAAATRSWTVDTVAPSVTITAGPRGPTGATSATFEFTTEATATTECRLDSGSWRGCDPVTSYANLSQGAHAFGVRATDAAGNTGEPSTRSWTVDTVGPNVTITEGPSGPTASTSARFSFAAEDGASFECQLDAGRWSSCTSPQSYLEMSQGEHTFVVRARDQLGNVGATTSRTWTVDTQGPRVSITAGPSETVRSTTATFTFSSEAGATFECALDRGAYGACTSPYTYENLSQGAHRINVRARDTAGNVGAISSRSWGVDTVAPTVTITSGPDAVTYLSEATFEFRASESSVQYQCRLARGTWSSCTSPQRYTGLRAGDHVFEVRATDSAGNVGSAVAYNWIQRNLG